MAAVRLLIVTGAVDHARLHLEAVAEKVAQRAYEPALVSMGELLAPPVKPLPVPMPDSRYAACCEWCQHEHSRAMFLNLLVIKYLLTLGRVADASRDLQAVLESVQ